MEPIAPKTIGSSGACRGLLHSSKYNNNCVRACCSHSLSLCLVLCLALSPYVDNSPVVTRPVTAKQDSEWHGCQCCLQRSPQQGSVH